MHFILKGLIIWPEIDAFALAFIKLSAKHSTYFSVDDKILFLYVVFLPFIPSYF